MKAPRIKLKLRLRTRRKKRLHREAELEVLLLQVLKSSLMQQHTFMRYQDSRSLVPVNRMWVMHPQWLSRINRIADDARMPVTNEGLGGRQALFGYTVITGMTYGAPELR